MSRIVLFGVVSCLLWFNSCSQDKLDNPEKVGIYAFELLKDINEIGQEKYLSYFMSVDEIKVISKKKDVVGNEKTRKSMEGIDAGRWNARVFKDFNTIREFGKVESIDWGNIEYDDFSYETLMIEGVTACKGDMYFRSDKRTFLIEIYCVFNGKEYRLVELEDIRKEVN